MNLRFKLLFPLLMTCCIFFTLIHFVWRPSFIELETEKIIARETNILKLLEYELASNILDSNLAALHAVLNNHLKINHPLWLQISVFNQDGLRLFPIEQVKPVEGDFIVTLEHSISWDDYPLAKLHLVIDQNHPIKEISRHINELELIAFILFSCLIFIGAIIQNYWLIKPIVHLKNAVKKLAGGNFNVDLAVKQHDEIGDLTQSFIQMRQDLFTTQKELKTITQTAQEREAKQRIIMSHIGAGVLTVSENNIIQDFNLAAEKIFGYSLDEIRGQSLLKLIPEKYREKQLKAFDRYLQSSVATIINQRLEIEGLHKKGYAFPIDLVVSEVVFESKRFFVGIISDISKQKLTEQTLIAAKEDAEKANIAKSQFLSSMSHELRTPLNAVLGFAHLLHTDDSLNKDQQENVAEIIKAGDHLLELITNVLDLAMIEAGKVAISIESVVLSSIIEDCYKLMAVAIDDKHIRFNVDYHALSTVIVKADPLRLKQVFLNLISNAVKYNVSGGQILITAELIDPNTWHIAVKDTGIGISEDKISFLFEHFNRLGSEKSNIQGTGIGLVITQSLVEMMQGKIEATSTEGIGSTFWVELENSPDGYQQQSVEIDDPVMEHVIFEPEKTVTILYVDDNEANRTFVQRALSRCQNIRFIEANDGESGIQQARALLPDLILLDIHMPGLDGNDVCRLLKKEMPLIPIIALSANAIKQDIEDSLQNGFDAYLTKPINIDQLMESISKLISCKPIA